MTDLIKGITVTLINKVQSGLDDFGQPIWSESAVDIENVLVAPYGSADLPVPQNLDGKKEAYQLAIPKGDSHVWEDQFVEFFGKRFRVVGPVIQGIESMIPTQMPWHKKVSVERYE